jgi:catechol 2,3-dioxygenase-like lactoylglutathione lyase family enzyme
VAREYGFPSWRALKAAIEQLQGTATTLYFEACHKGDADTVRRLVASDPSLVRATPPGAQHRGWTGLHEAAKNGYVDTARVLLEYGADPNARDAGDNTYPLHWAAAHRQLEIVRMLLDAGGDVHGFGDVHELDAIGWATVFHPGESTPGDKPEVAALLVERGARHHIFSAISIGDVGLIRQLVHEDPKAMERRMSRFEHGATPLHFALNGKRYDILELLIELGADLEGRDRDGHTALEAAMLHGDREAVRRLVSAGARKPKRVGHASIRSRMSRLADSVQKFVPMIYVPDVAAALDWYKSLGFKEIARYEDEGLINFGVVSFGKAEILINMNGKRGPHDVSLWLYTDHVDDFYKLLKSRQFEAALSDTAGVQAEIDFVEHINDTFYGARQFAIRDPNGYIVFFMQQLRR